MKKGMAAVRGRECMSLWPTAFNAHARSPCRFDEYRTIFRSKDSHTCRVHKFESDNEGTERRKKTRLPSPPNLGGKQPDKSWNPSSLAFLGDSVWELYARNLFFHPPMHASKYRGSVVKVVRAEAQSEAFTKLLDNDILTEKEEEILRWGKNASGTLPKRLSTDKLKMSVYREATAVECLVGYLYASGNGDRLDVIMEYLGLMPSE